MPQWTLKLITVDQLKQWHITTLWLYY